MTNDETKTATLTLTIDQWKCLLCHVRNDLELMRAGLFPQIGKANFDIMENNAQAVLSEVIRATGIEEDLS